MVSKEWIDQWSAMSKGAMNSMMRMQKIGVNAMDRLTQQQMGLMNEAAAEGMKQFESLGQVTNPQDILSDQTETASIWMEKLMENGRQNMALLTEVQGEMSQLMEEVMAASVDTGAKPSGGKKAA